MKRLDSVHIGIIPRKIIYRQLDKFLADVSTRVYYYSEHKLKDAVRDKQMFNWIIQDRITYE